MNPLIGLLLDDGARGLAQTLLGIAACAVVLLLATIVVPVAILIGLFGVAGSRGAPQAQQPVGEPPPVIALPTPAPLGDGPVQVARRYLGVPYVFGGSDPATGLDCSGLVQLVFRQLGIQLPRTAQLQYDATTRITREQLLPGDLVFFARTYAEA